MQVIWVAYGIAAAGASVPFLVAGLRNRRPPRVPNGAGTPRHAPSAPDDAFPPTLGDASEAIHIALKRLMPVITAQSVRIDVAARRGLLVRMRGPVLADLMEELIAAALHSAPVSALLLTASAHGDRIYISLSDDVPGADASVRQSMLRGLAERVAMRGGALDVQVRPKEGTTITLRVMAAFESPAEAIEYEARPVAVTAPVR